MRLLRRQEQEQPERALPVVADEVGNLAQKSAKAAQNTGLLIEETIEAVEREQKSPKKQQNP